MCISSLWRFASCQAAFFSTSFPRLWCFSSVGCLRPSPFLSVFLILDRVLRLTLHVWLSLPRFLIWINGGHVDGCCSDSCTAHPRRRHHHHHHHHHTANTQHTVCTPCLSYHLSHHSYYYTISSNSNQTPFENTPVAEEDASARLQPSITI